MQDLTDDDVLLLVYREHQDSTIAMELARRLEAANDKLESIQTQTHRS